ncbi:MAG: class I SAM-dependent methyltransferase [Fluviicola sp.]|nr:class I SAM-dependent methyltransferase [Fluviicola sp.]
MNKKEGFKVLFNNPFAVLKEGVKVQQQKYHKSIIKKKYNLEQLPTINILDLLPNLDDKIRRYSFLTGTSLITDLVLLRGLAKSFDKCSYMEIGSWRGESLANVSDVVEECLSITLSAEDMKGLGYPDSFADVHGVFSKDLENLTVIEANSHTFDFSSLNKKFDLIFVDGDHSYGGVLNDTKKVFNLRRESQSIIVWHDYAFNTEDVRYTTMKAILDGIPEEYHKNLYHVSNTMCAVYIENANFKTSQIKFPTYPDKEFTLSVRATKLD